MATLPTTETIIIATATDAVNTELAGKKFYQSKTFWANVIAIIGLSAQIKYGYVVSPEIQTLTLALINLVLRSYTKQPIVWTMTSTNPNV